MKGAKYVNCTFYIKLRDDVGHGNRLRETLRSHVDERWGHLDNEDASPNIM